MCLIVHRYVGESGRGSNLPNSVISTNQAANGDGFGVAWRTSKGALRHDKFGPKDFEPFHKLLKRLDKDTKAEYVAHFRTATHGPACQELAHPFTYDDPEEGEVAVFHNGILSIETAKDESDTERFVRDLLSELPSRWWAIPAYKALVEMAAEDSRFVIMTARETVRINAALGETKGGIWYSTNPTPSWAAYASAADSIYQQGMPPGTWKKEGNRWVKKVSPGQWEAREYAMAAPTALPVVWRNDEADPEVRTCDIRDWDETVVGAAFPTGGWTHGGHVVVPLGSVKVADHNGNVVCPTCKTEGEYYKIDGSIYIDIAHVVRVEDEDEEGVA